MDLKRFKAMIGRTYLYMANYHTIEAIDELPGGVLLAVKTNLRTIKVPAKELRENFIPAPKSGGGQELVLAAKGLKVDNQDMKGLSDVLLDNIRRVQNDSEYIPQAKAINESAKTIIAIKKAQIDMVKLLTREK